MKESKRIALRTAAAYAIIALAWILISDFLVAMLPYPVISAVQSAKGFLFVAVTAIAIFVLVERLNERITEEAVRSGAAERMLDQVVSTVPVGVLLTSDDGTITFMNHAAEDMFGMPSSQATGRGIDELCCSSQADAAATIGELMRTGAVEDVELGGREGGTPRSAFARAAQIDPTLPASGWVIAVGDITESHRARVAAERLVGGYRFLALALDAITRATDERTLTKRIAEVAVESGRYCAAWALGRDEQTGRFFDVAAIGMGPRSIEIATMMRDRAESDSTAVPFGTGEIVVSNDVTRDPANVWHPAAEEESFGSVATFVVRSGEHLVGALTLFASETGGFDAREVELLQSLVDSLTFAVGRMHLDRKRFDAEQELEHSEKGYRELFEKNPAPMWVFDRETLRFLAVNDAAVAKYGYSAEEFLSMTAADIRPPDGAASFRNSLASRRRGFGDVGIWEHRDKGGREFPAHVYSHSIEWDGHDAELVMAMEVARFE